MASKNGTGKILRRGAAALAGIAAGVLLLEAGAWALFPQYRLPKLFTPLGEGEAPAYKPSGLLGWEPAGPVYANAAGFFAHGPRDVPGALRVLFLGDSVGNGLFRFFHDEWIGGLARAAGRPVELADYCVAGYGLGHYRRVLEHRAERFDPAVVVIVFCLNDSGTFAPVIVRRNGRLEMMKDTNLGVRLTYAPLLFRWSHLYRAAYLGRHWDALSRGDEKNRVPNEESFRAIKTWAEKRGTRILSVVFPYFDPPNSAFDLATQNRADMKRLLAGEGKDALWLEDVFPPGFEKAFRNAEPHDYIHPNKAGYEAAWKAIVPFLEERLAEGAK